MAIKIEEKVQLVDDIFPLTLINEDMGKRGRKPKGEGVKGYFLEREEQAVVDYNNTNDGEEKNRIYNEILKPAFATMIESIIRRYHLYVPEEEFEHTFNDTLSQLLTKINKYNPEKGCKAFSYCGTVAKNYLYQRNNQYRKQLIRNTPYDDISSSLEDDIKYSEEIEGETSLATDIIGAMSQEIKKMLDNKDKLLLTENEVKIGNALSLLLDKWEDVLEIDGSNKLNKSTVLYFLREETRLGTTDIRNGMKRYKNIYSVTKSQFLN